MLDIYKEIVDKKLQLEEDITKIKLQLEEAKLKFALTGIMVNSFWFNKAKYALEMKKIELKKLNAEYEKLKRTIKEDKRKENRSHSKTFERAFMQICKDILPSEEFEKAIALTYEVLRQEEKDKANMSDINIKSRWRNEDEEYLIANHKNFTIEELALTLNRSENSIKSKIQVIKKKQKIAK